MRRLLKKYYGNNPDKLTTTSPPVDKGALPPLMAAQLGAEITLFTSALFSSFTHKHLRVHKNLPVQLRHSKHHQTPMART